MVILYRNINDHVNKIDLTPLRRGYLLLDKVNFFMDDPINC